MLEMGHPQHVVDFILH